MGGVFGEIGCHDDGLREQRPCNQVVSTGNFVLLGLKG